MPPIRLKPDGTNFCKLIRNAVLGVLDLDSPVVPAPRNNGGGANAGCAGAEGTEGAKKPPPVRAGVCSVVSVVTSSTMRNKPHC
jgi:hypothetical protein